MIEMFVTEHHHVDLVGGIIDMVKACDEVRVILGQPDIDHDRALCAAHEIGVGGAVLEADLVDVLGCLNQSTAVAVQNV